MIIYNMIADETQAAESCTENNPKVREYRFTVNNYTDTDIEQVKNLVDIYHVQYLVIGKEIGPKCGTPHLQCFVLFKNAVYWNSLRKKVPRGIFFTCDASNESNAKYCKKDVPENEEVYYEYGALGPGQGKRTDIQRTRDVLNGSGRIRDVLVTTTGNQCVRFAQNYLTYLEKKRNWKPNVEWWYGPTGTGKSTTAERSYEDPYLLSDPNWWDGYDAHETVILDDFRADWWRWDHLLRVTGGTQCRIPYKGGFRQLLARTIIITAPVRPEQMFSHIKEDLNQLLRRITKIRYFGPDEQMEDPNEPDSDED